MTVNLQRSSKAATKNEAHDAKSQKKSYDDPRLQRAAHDLERALVEIDDLKTQLKEKDRQLKLEVKHSDKVNDKLGKYAIYSIPNYVTTAMVINLTLQMASRRS